MVKSPWFSSILLLEFEVDRQAFSWFWPEYQGFLQSKCRSLFPPRRRGKASRTDGKSVKRIDKKALPALVTVSPSRQPPADRQDKGHPAILTSTCHSSKTQVRLKGETKADAHWFRFYTGSPTSSKSRASARVFRSPASPRSRAHGRLSSKVRANRASYAGSPRKVRN